VDKPEIIPIQAATKNGDPPKPGAAALKRYV